MTFEILTSNCGHDGVPVVHVVQVADPGRGGNPVMAQSGLSMGLAPAGKTPKMVKNLLAVGAAPRTPWELTELSRPLAGLRSGESEVKEE